MSMVCILAIIRLAYLQNNMIAMAPAVVLGLINTGVLFLSNPKGIYYFPTCNGQYEFDKIGLVYVSLQLAFTNLVIFILMVFRIYCVGFFTVILLFLNIFLEFYVFNNLVCSQGDCYNQKITCRAYFDSQNLEDCKHENAAYDCDLWD